MHVSGNLPELWPELKLPDLPRRAEAIQLIHFPAEPADADKARERLALDEFLALQVEICRRRRNLQTKGKACACGGDNRWIKPFLAGQLGFPTAAKPGFCAKYGRDCAARIPCGDWYKATWARARPWWRPARS
jgi:RecG-like helicase